MNTLSILLRTLLLIVLLMSAAGCDGRTVNARKTSELFFQGQVVDLGTHKPIPGAIVTWRWQETVSMIADSQSRCSHIESAVTDAQGRYQLPTWKGYEPTFIDAYKPGYAETNEYARTWQFNTRFIYPLEPFKGTREERVEYLLNQARKECGSKDDYAPKLIPLYRALYEEARSIAVTKEDKMVVKTLHYSADVLELGEAEADRKLYGRVYDNE